MIDCGYPGNDASTDLYMAVFAHPPRRPNFTQKNEGGLIFFISNFATLSQRTTLHFFFKDEAFVRIFLELSK